MKRKSLLFFLLFALLAPLAMNGQTRATVNWGSASDNNGSTYAYSPFGRWYGWEYKVFCYRPNTLPFSGNITQIGFLPAVDADAGTNTSSSITINGSTDNNPMQIWMKEVTGNYALEGSTSFATYVNGATKVYSGNIPATTDGTMASFTLSTSFSHSQENSLLILVRTVANSSSGDNSQDAYYKTLTGDVNLSWYAHQDRTDPGSNVTGSVQTNNLPVLSVTYTASTTPRITLSPSSATISPEATQTLTATVANVSGTPSISYSTSNGSVATVTGNGTTATVTGVAPGTATITASMTVNGSTYTATSVITVEVPCDYSEDFEGVTGTSGYSAAGSLPSGWNYIWNGSNTAYAPHVYLSSQTSTPGLPSTGNYLGFYASGDQSQYSYAIMPAVAAGESVSHISFKYKFESAGYGTLTYGVIDGTDESTYQILGTISSPSTNPGTVDEALSTGATNGKRIAFRWDKSSTWYTCGIDDICIMTSTAAPTFTIAASADPAASGSVNGAGSYQQGASCTLTATANQGYVFDNWTENGSVVSTNATYTFTVSSNRTLVANFSLSCPPPTLQPVSGITNNSATISWTGSEASSFNVRYRALFYEGFENGIPSTWTTIDADGDGNNWFALSEMATLYPAYANASLTNWCHNGNNSAVSASAYNNTDGETYTPLNSNHWLISPQIDLGGTLTFYAKSTDGTYQDSFEVLLSQSGTATSDFSTSLRTMTAASYDDWDKVEISLGAYSGQGYIAIHHVSEDNYFLLIDDFSISGNPWETPSNSPVSTNSITLTGLNAETTYEVEVQADCGNDDTSAWVSTTFTTLDDCAVPYELEVANPIAPTSTLNWTGAQEKYNVQYREVITPAVDNTYDFEDNSMQGWTTISNDNDNNAWSVQYTSIYAHGGNYCVRARYTSSSVGGEANDWLISPQISLGGTFSFYARRYNTSNTDRFRVYVSTTDNTISSFAPISSVITPNATYDLYEYDLSSYSGNGYVAIVYTAPNDQYYLYVDDITITVPGQYGAWVNKTNVTSPLNITGLTPSTNYEWQVQGVNCDGNDGTTDWSASATFTTLDGYVKHIDNWSSAGYYLISSPIATDDNPTNPEDVTNMLTPKNGTANTYDLYRFDQAQALEWRNYRQGVFNLEVGKGYLYGNNSNSEGVDLVFTGTAYSGNGVVTLSKTAAGDGLDFPDWNLVGNPFPVKAYITKPYYTMNSTGSEIIGITGNSVEPMEGIFVIANTNGETLTFSTTAPAKRGSNLTLNLTDGGSLIDRAIVSFSESEQLPKFQLNRNSTKLYIPQDGKDYAVVCSEEMGAMPVNFKAEDNGTYTLNFSCTNVGFAYLHLIDNKTGNDVDLLQTPSYSFEAKTTDYESRFKLVFATGDNSNDDNFAFFSNGSFVINNDGTAELQVIDLMGRILSSETINGCTNVNVNAAPGVYMLRLINGTDVKVQKVVVK